MLQTIILLAIGIGFMEFCVWYSEYEEQREEYVKLRLELEKMKELDEFRYKYFM